MMSVSERTLIFYQNGRSLATFLKGVVFVVPRPFPSVKKREKPSLTSISLKNSLPFAFGEQCGPGSNPGVDAICGLSLLLVLSLAPRGFSPGTPVFPSSQKPTFPNSNSTRSQVDEEPLCGCATCKSLFIHFPSKYYVCLGTNANKR